MAAPSGTTWGSIAGDYGRIGIYIGISNSNTQTTVTVSTWFWSKYSVSDTSNSYYYNNDSTSATTKIGSVSLKTTYNSGSGWDALNQVKLGETNYTYNRGTSDVTKNCAIKLTDVDRVGATMTHTRSYTIPKLSSYTVSYNANGGSGAPSSQTKWYGKSLTLSSTKPTRTGYSFQGWATSASGGVAYSSGGSYTANSGATLYAVWKANTYTVKYDANGGTGAPGNQTKTYGVTLKLSTVTPTRTNYNFKGWATSKTATVANYAAGANYTANSAVTLYAVWELAYVKPRITEFTVIRVKPIENEDGTTTYEENEEGTYAKARLKFECDRLTSEVKIEWKSAKTTDEVLILSEYVGVTSANVDQIIFGEGRLSTEYTYSISVTVTDEVDKSVKFAIISGLNIPIDVIIDEEDGPKGISFGKPAELEGKADFQYEIYPRNGFSNILLEPETDLNTVMTPNTYIGENTSTYNYVNCPITSGTFTLEVAAGGKDGQRVQTLTVCSKDKFIIWKRFYYSGDWTKDSDGNYYWIKEFDVAGTILWSGAWFMHGTQSAPLSQKVSEQAHGIVLIFSEYVNGSGSPTRISDHFVSKYSVEAFPGRGHDFNLCGVYGLAAKYLYIHDDHIEGNDYNDDASLTIGGLTYTNNRYVLRYVIGI